jgi:hypothetical protein
MFDVGINKTRVAGKVLIVPTGGRVLIEGFEVAAGEEIV